MMIPSSPPTHHETTLITIGIRETECISPAPREAPVDATDQITPIKPLSSIAFDLIKGRVHARYII